MTLALLVTILGLLFLAGGGWTALVASICPVPDGLFEKGAVPPPCPEFWVSRYQTVVAAVLALLTAWFATRPVRGQLKEMRRQSAATARLAMLEQGTLFEQEYDRWTETLRVLRQVESLLEHRSDTRPGAAVLYLDAVDRILAEVSASCLQESKYATRFQGADKTTVARSFAIGALLLVEAALRNFRRSVSIHGPAYEVGETDIPEDEEAGYVPALHDAAARAVAAAESFLEPLAGEMKASWRRVRELERAALAE